MSQESQELPTLREELERKTVDELQTLVYRAENERLDKETLGMLGHTLWTVTSGLVSREVSELCSATANSTKPRKLSRQFIGKGSVLTVTWMPDGQGYVVCVMDATTFEKKLRPIKSEIGMREEELKKLFGTLCKSGYQQL
jgi:hypothetical protein